MTEITLAQLAAFNLTLLAAMAAPGPAFLLALRNAVVGGRRAGILTGIGLATVAAFWTGCALLGLAALFELVPWLFLAMKIAGALYLLFLAWGLWRDARTPLDQSQDRSSARPMRQGMLINLANPKSVLFAGAVIVVIFPAGLSLPASALIVLNHFVVEIVVYTLMALLLSTPAAQRSYLRAKVWADRTAGLILGALGLRLLIER
ncbi:MAG: LysE family transporter [Pseudomonadota bacterium]